MITSLGVLAVVAALAAERLGLEQDSGWGPARKFLLGMGILLLLLPHAGTLARYVFGCLPGAVRARLQTWFSLPAVDASSPGKAPDQSATAAERRALLSLPGSLLAVLLAASLVMTWLVSVGRWSDWPATTSYYHLLAEGFRAGKTHLLVEPGDELLALSDPYDPAQRTDLPYLWDVSLYDGKYYLYWGPTPALAALLVEPLLGHSLTDGDLVWGFSLLLVVANLSLLWGLWRRAFHSLPWWTILPPALVLAFANPLLWLMGRPAVYEAAIIGGQLCLMMGVLLLLPVFFGPMRRVRAVLAGCAWGLAIASRITLAPAIGFLVVVTGVMILRNASDRGTRRVAVGVLDLSVPLVVTLALLAAYNYDRFGSVLELGHRFQLGRWYKPTTYDSLLAVVNLPINVFNYSLNPFRWLPTFPFIKPTWGKYALPLLHLTATANYHTEQVTGVLVAAPFSLFGLVPLAVWMKKVWSVVDRQPAERVWLRIPGFSIAEARLYGVFGVTLLLAAGPLLVLSINSMRHELDFLPLLSLVGAMGFAYALRRGAPNRHLFRAVFLVGVLAAAFTAWAGIMLAITGYNAQFENLNPALFEALSRFFTP